MKKVYLLLVISAIAVGVISAIVVGCGNNQRSTNSSMNEEEFQEYDSKKHEEGMIAIETTFEPTLELTIEIRNSTLEELIRKGKGKLSKYDQAKQDEYIKKRRNEMKKEGFSDDQINSSPYINLIPPKPYVSQQDMNREYKLKYVPATSNLAKVYYLEDMGRFIEHNEKFYNEIISKMQEESTPQKEQKNWDKYL